MFHVDVAKGDWDVACVSEAYCKRLFEMFRLFFRRMFASVFYSDVAYVLNMLQEYVPMILDVSVLCCSKCFHLQDASVLSGCCICFTHIL